LTNPFAGETWHDFLALAAALQRGLNAFFFLQVLFQDAGLNFDPTS
jgi:hypothetical protein